MNEELLVVIGIVFVFCFMGFMAWLLFYKDSKDSLDRHCGVYLPPPKEKGESKE